MQSTSTQVSVTSYTVLITMSTVPYMETLKWPPTLTIVATDEEIVFSDKWILKPSPNKVSFISMNVEEIFLCYKNTIKMIWGIIINHLMTHCKNKIIKLKFYIGCFHSNYISHESISFNIIVIQCKDHCCHCSELYYKKDTSFYIKDNF